MAAVAIDPHAVVLDAETYLDVREVNGNNITRINAEFGGPEGVAYCAMGVSLWLTHAGRPTHIAWVPGIVTGAIWAGEWHDGTDGIREGDVGVADWQGLGFDQVDPGDHTFVARGPVDPDDGRVPTIEANTSADDPEVAGEGVFYKRRRPSIFLGYWRPSEYAAPGTPAFRPLEEAVMAIPTYVVVPFGPGERPTQRVRPEAHRFKDESLFCGVAVTVSDAGGDFRLTVIRDDGTAGHYSDDAKPGPRRFVVNLADPADDGRAGLDPGQSGGLFLDGNGVTGADFVVSEKV
jgi:hypothetical protein